MTKKLAVFDFDHTIIHDNSDIVVMNLIDNSKIPREVKQLHRRDGWTAFMQGVFETLYRYGIDEETINDVVTKLPAVPGMIELIKEMNEKLDFDVIVISDSNSYFINNWLSANDLDQNVKKVFTNPAHFEKGLLKIEMYHFQEICKLSTKNLCKGQIMQDFVVQQKNMNEVYDRVIYCGDGLNDICPILRLTERDLACVRDGFKCSNIIQKAKDGWYVDAEGIPRKINSDICFWKSGFDILDCIQLQNIE